MLLRFAYLSQHEWTRRKLHYITLHPKVHYEDAVLLDDITSASLQAATPSISIIHPNHACSNSENHVDLLCLYAEYYYGMIYRQFDRSCCHREYICACRFFAV